MPMSCLARSPQVCGARDIGAPRARELVLLREIRALKPPRVRHGAVALAVSLQEQPAERADLARGARSPASAMPRSDRSPGEYSSHRGTPKKAPPSDRSSDYDSEEDDGPTLFGSILRTLMAGGAVVAIAVLVRVASAFQTRKRGASLRVLAVDIASRAP